MQAVVNTQGKQYRVKAGDVIKVERMDLAEGSPVELSQVLLLEHEGSVTVGKPTVPGAKVVAKVVEQGKDKKILVLHFRAKKHYRKRQGHRQMYTKLAIEQVLHEPA